MDSLAAMSEKTGSQFNKQMGPAEEMGFSCHWPLVASGPNSKRVLLKAGFPNKIWVLMFHLSLDLHPPHPQG